jgi:predicted CoA-binding protein
MKKTLVIGASINTERYSNIAIKMLREYNHQVEALGLKIGNVDDVKIFTEAKQISDLHTVTIYLNSNLQKQYYDYIISLKPKRIIFNPGTENYELKKIAEKNNIQTIEACTLVMLRTGNF